MTKNYPNATINEYVCLSVHISFLTRFIKSNIFIRIFILLIDMLFDVRHWRYCTKIMHILTDILTKKRFDLFGFHL